MVMTELSYLLPAGGPSDGLLCWEMSHCGRSLEVWCGVPTHPAGIMPAEIARAAVGSP